MRYAVLAVLMVLLPTLGAAQPYQAPERQAAFEALLRDLGARSRDAANDAGRVALRQELARRVVADGYRRPRGWIGNVVRVDADSAGNVEVVINLLRGSALVTNIMERDHRRIGHPIWPNSPLVAAVSKLRRGDMVRFDGEFSCAMRDNRPQLDCPRTPQMTHSGALDMPIFLVSFTKIEKID